MYSSSAFTPACSHSQKVFLRWNWSEDLSVASALDSNVAMHAVLLLFDEDIWNDNLFVCSSDDCFTHDTRSNEQLNDVSFCQCQWKKNLKQAISQPEKDVFFVSNGNREV